MHICKKATQSTAMCTKCIPFDKQQQQQTKKERKKKKKKKKEEEVFDPSSNHFPQIPSLYSHCLMAVRYTW